jgi:Neprosin
MPQSHNSVKARRIGLLVSTVFAAAGGVGCGASGDAPAPPSPAAADETVGASAQSSPSAAQAAARIQSYIDSRYTSKDVQSSFVTRYGETVDCIDFYAQPGVKALAARGVSVPLPTPPAMLPADTALAGAATGLEEAAFDGSPDVNGAPRRCAGRTVPYVRLTADRINRAGGLDTFGRAVGSKALPHGSAPPDPLNDASFIHVYGSYKETPLNAGGAVISVFDPQVPLYGVGHSIGQTWTVNATVTQSVEIGWNVDRNLYGDGLTHLFVDGTNDGYATTGCYNNDPSTGGGRTCLPWIGAPGARFTPDQVLPSGPYELFLATKLTLGVWWVGVGISQKVQPPSIAIGGYFAGDYSGSMQTQADTFQFGGEVAASTTGGTDFSQMAMGSGVCAEFGFPNAAWVRNSEIQDLHGNIITSQPALASEDTGSPSRYDFSLGPNPQPSVMADSWNHFFFGGLGTTPRCNGGD